MILELFILLNCLTLKVSYYNFKERDHTIISNSLSIISKHHQEVPYLKMKTKIISIILLILIVPPILFCVLNSSYELYINHQENIAYSKMQQAVDKHDDLETPYKYSISALKSNGKWAVYIKEEPFGKEKSYRED